MKKQEEKELSDAEYILNYHLQTSTDNLRDGFLKILNTRGLLVKLGMPKGQVSNIKDRIKKGSWPEENTMRKWLLLAGWSHTPEKWEEPKKSPGIIPK